MHIPDGFLSAPVWSAFDVLAPPALGIAARRAQRGLDERNVPLLGVMGAFVFAAQMINFPVGPGTSGHLVGAALLAIALGPAAASVVMASILAVQALAFQDGGILSLGANIFNIAIAGVLASAAFALAELILSGVPVPRRVLLLSMGFFFAGALVEGGITLAAVRAMERLNPRWFRTPEETAFPAPGWIAAAALLLVAAGVLAASTYPDGIERLAAAHAPAWVHAPLAGYSFQGVEPPWLRRVLAAAAGLLLIYGACLWAGRLISRRSA